jgi:hypothetical protein
MLPFSSASWTDDIRVMAGFSEPLAKKW